jgi:3-hydroxyisobutyrate dehydrogenase
VPAAKRIGFIGLGIMGSRMAANLQRAGFEVTVWNRTQQTAHDWAAEHGGHLAPVASVGRGGGRPRLHDGRRRPAGP